MAFRNAVKATLLLDQEEARPRSDEAGAIFETPAPLAKRVPSVKPRAAGEAFLAATWHRRAAELCAMAETLPSKSSWTLISKIACLYDELARDAGWAEGEDAAPVPDELHLDEPQAEGEPQPDEELPAPVLPRELRTSERAAFRRRPLPGRTIPRRRA